MEQMPRVRAVLCALNSKYVHVNLAVRCLSAYADAHAAHFCCTVIEGTVNEPTETLFRRILEAKPHIVAFSTYIWNVSTVRTLCGRLRSVFPDVPILLGGPEVTYAPHVYLTEGVCDYVLRGEGEKPFTALCNALAAKLPIPTGLGICRRNGETGEASVADDTSALILEEPYVEEELASLESPYTPAYLAALPGRMAYVETSRGCPYSCAFCLSGVCRGVRFFPMDEVKRFLPLVWSSGAGTVKFIDRTFNADKARAKEILRFISEHRTEIPPDVCFHFEVAADRLDEELLTLLEQAPVGLFQLEAGLQSFNPQTLEAVSRHTDLEKLCTNVRRIAASGRVHIHIDLIAGLPYEDFASFRDSFNKAYALNASMLQLGFLKLLYGSALRDSADAYDYVFDSEPPYEIRSTAWLSAEEMTALHAVEDACDRLHNTGRFRDTLAYVFEVTHLAPFDLFYAFGKKPSMPLDEYTALAFDFFAALPDVDRRILRDKLCCDRLRTNRSAKLPPCLKIPDARLARLTARLADDPHTAPVPGVRRAVCILYSRNELVYADYPACEKSRKSGSFGEETRLHFLPLAAYSERTDIPQRTNIANTE